MVTHKLISERPSALPAAAVHRVCALLPNPAGHRDRAVNSGVPWTDEFVGSDATVAALHATRLRAGSRISGQASNVPTPIPVSPYRSKQMEIKQVNAGPTYQTNGVGGVPPRGRPN